MRRMRSVQFGLMAAVLAGCATKPVPYGQEQPLTFNTARRPLWAVAPALNLSGEGQIDPLLQADIVYQQLQAVGNITVIPVNRVVEVYAALRIDKVQSEQQAALVCEQLGCDALVIPTVTAYDPYDPPKVGASLQLLGKTEGFHHENVDARQLAREMTPNEHAVLAGHADFRQAVGMYDAANGSVRTAVLDYAKGRHDPLGPLGDKEYFVNMDRYCGFVYHALIANLIEQVENNEAAAAAAAHSG